MLNLGLFMMPLHPADKDVSVSYEEDRQLVILADKLHFTEAWMGEHYSSIAEPVTSPLIFNASLISETTNIKFGTGVISLPQQHPAVVAGQVFVRAKGRDPQGPGYLSEVSTYIKVISLKDGTDLASAYVPGTIDGQTQSAANIEAMMLSIENNVNTIARSLSD